ncbi:MAG: DegQ family serine endoprotease [Gammaproteobacteria bacterium]|nr:DegQ family serine endoprotease [Gammaproteobacteria bacterium]MDH5691853.1 DegQ family serine endoprotease [Gammaproteobacteria bacterium]
MKRVLVGLIMAVVLSATEARDLPDFTTLVEKNAPAVVNISTEQNVKTKARAQRNLPPGMPENGPFNDWFKHFFGEEDDGERGEDGRRFPQSLGSGFLISSDGYILTNNHVIEDADKIIVRLSDRRELEAELIGKDKRSDLALIKIKGDDLPKVSLGNSEKLKPGEWVLAIGSPFGFDYSVTAGVVSAKGRSLPRENYVPFIQTDVAINPGNSGGPLFNLKGEVIGINSQIYSRTGGYMGLSFAIPINMAMNVVEQLKKNGYVKRGWLGVLIQDVTRELAESFDMKKPHGALVARVLPDSPAEKAGFEVGDIVVEFNSEEIDHSSDLPPKVGITPIDKSVPVQIIRKGKRKMLKVMIGELPSEDDTKVSKNESDSQKFEGRLGISVVELTPPQRERMQLKDQGGVFVNDVKQGSPAREAGVRRGDVILMVNNIDIKDLDHFNSVVKGLPDDKLVPLLINRAGSPIFLAMRVSE